MKASIFFSFLIACFLTGCTSDDELQDLEKQHSAAKSSIVCYPDFGSLSANATVTGQGLNISWRGCDYASHNHTYTVQITGSESGTYTTKDKFITLPYTIHSSSSNYNITVTNSYENTGKKSISGFFEIIDGTLRQTTNCSMTMARINASHCYMGSYNQTEINLILDISTGTHNTFYTQVYTLVNGVPGETVSSTDYLLASGRDVINIYTSDLNCDGKTTYRIRFTPYIYKCSPDANTTHYLYGDFIPTKETGHHYSIQLHEVKKTDGSYW